jgi:putative phosphoserine phosphatase/1-acylglycerol-3-phosphate O-acyltransferase
VDTLRSGLSVALAPEGTRSRGTEPGRFRKGGFRLAMAAGVPVVPIVIRNARDVLPRGAWLMRPATVRVLVHEPISTAGWRAGDLDAHVAAVERLYASTLGTVLAA